MTDRIQAEVRTARGPKRLGDWLRGRMGRTAYWIFIALIFAFSVLVSTVTDKGANGLVVALIIVLIPRLHDFGRTGWWVLAVMFGPLAVMLLAMLALPIDTAALIGVLAEVVGLIWVGVIRGDAGDNRFGPPSRGWKADLLGR